MHKSTENPMHQKDKSLHSWGDKSHDILKHFRSEMGVLCLITMAIIQPWRYLVISIYTLESK